MDWEPGLERNMTTSAFLSAPARALQPLLADAVLQAAVLQEALQAEAEALKQRDIAVIEQAVANKREVALSLDRLAHEQTALLLSSGFTGDAEGMQAFLASHDAPEADLGAQWSRLESLMQECRRLNEINGIVVQQSQQFVQQIIHALRGQENPATRLYDPLGRAVTDTASRPISKA